MEEMSKSSASSITRNAGNGTNDANVQFTNMVQKGTKETRANEALAMKDEQLRILSDQNGHLLVSLNALDDEIAKLKLTKLTLEEENRSLRDQNFDLQSKTRAAEANLKKIQSGMEEKDTQVKVLTDHNTELLRLLEQEESQSHELARNKDQLSRDLETLQSRYASLLASAKAHEEIATRASRESQLRAEEIRLLRNENDQLRVANNEMKLKTSVEIESLQEQLRVRKEKQYQLLEKLQQLEEKLRQQEDVRNVLEDKQREQSQRILELETQCQLETKAKRAQMETNKTLVVENGNLSRDKDELRLRFDKAESERSRMESENRDSAEQLREMAEKVFQLLERLKLAELSKTKAIESLKHKETELTALKKKNARLLKEASDETKAKVKSELDKTVLMEQITALKKHNGALSQRCCEEVKSKLQQQEENKSLSEKNKTLSGRIGFLLNKMQADEELKILTKEEMKQLAAQNQSFQEKNGELTSKLCATAESNRVLTEALRCKQDEVDSLHIKMDALLKKMEMAQQRQMDGAIGYDDTNGAAGAGFYDNQVDDVQSNLSGRFLVEARAAYNGMLQIKAKRTQAVELHANAVAYLDKSGLNKYLKHAQKATNCTQLLVEKIALLLSDIMMIEEAVVELKRQLGQKDEQMTYLSRKTMMLQEKLTLEEDAKRKTLLRYVHEIKAHAQSDIGSMTPGAGGLGATSPAGVGAPMVVGGGGAVLKLPESGIGDEEVHAIAALLRNQSNVKELLLRNNKITNEGARAIAVILSLATCQLKHVDLRQNQIGKEGIRVLAEALERNERIKHVYVHAGGKIEALGTSANALEARISSGGATGPSVDATANMTSMIGVETICVVDVRDNESSLRNSGDNELLMADVDEFDGEGTTTTSGGGPLALKFKSLPLKSGVPSNPRPLSAAALEKQRKEKNLRKKKKQDEEKRNQRRETEWQGRAGGLDMTAITNGIGSDNVSPVNKKLPPISSSQLINRSNSAPMIKNNTTTTENTMPTTGESGGVGGGSVDDPSVVVDPIVQDAKDQLEATVLPATSIKKKKVTVVSSSIERLRDSPLANSISKPSK